MFYRWHLIFLDLKVSYLRVFSSGVAQKYVVDSDRGTYPLGALALTLWFCSYALAEPVLIQSPQTTLVEFLAYAETEPIKTYTQYQLEKNQKTARPVHLQSLLKQAQMDFLSHEPNQSKKSFQNIADHIHSFDWNKEERKIIFYALFRLAQLEKDPKKQILLLKEALAFSMGLKVDTKLFPPPVTNQYTKVKKMATFVPLKLNKIFPLHSVVIINGRAYSHKEELALPYGLYRVSAFSTSHKSWTQTLSLSRLISKKLKTPALVSGSCQKPILSHQFLHEQSVRILFPNFCVWDSSLSLAKQEKNLLPTQLKIAEQLKAPEEEKSYLEEWIWLGVAVVVGGTAIWALTRNAKPNKNPEPKPKQEPQKPVVKIGF